MDIKLQRLEMSDVPRLALIANNMNISDNLRDIFPHPYSEKDAESFIRKTLEENPERTFGIHFNNALCCVTGLVPQEDVYRISAELGYWVGEEFWGRGIATEAVRLITAYGFQELELMRIYSGVFEMNPASMRVLEKNGFQKDCIFKKSIIKNNVIMDEHRYSKISNS
jgi:RimJ/RimL family protein N-acetyltransferase